jgi:RNA polymerase sigma-70 factor (ECF subfamily)
MLKAIANGAIAMQRRASAGERPMSEYSLEFGRGAEPVAAGPTQDDCLMERIRERDVHALEELYRTYNSRLTAYLMRLVPRPQIIEEAIDDTMMAIWDRPDSFRGDCGLSTWLFTIAYHKALTALRRRDRPVEAPETISIDCDEAGPDEELRRERVNLLLSSAISKLAPDHRTVIDLSYFHEMDYREISQIMACPINTVKSRMFYARRQLRRILTGDLAEWL